MGRKSPQRLANKEILGNHQRSGNVAWSRYGRFPESCLTDGKILNDAGASGSSRGSSAWIGGGRRGGRPNGRRGTSEGRASSNTGRADRPTLRGRYSRGLPPVRHGRRAAGLHRRRGRPRGAPGRAPRGGLVGGQADVRQGRPARREGVMSSSRPGTEPG